MDELRGEDEFSVRQLLTPEEKREAVNLIESGRSLTAVSQKFDVPESVLRGLARETRNRSRRGGGARAEVELTENGPVETAPPARRQPERIVFVPQRAAANFARRLSVALVERGRRPYVSPGRSALNHWRLVAAVVAAAVLAALTLGVVRKPVYTADAKLVVGKTVQLNNLAAIPGLAVAGQEIASDYSRLISTAIVTKEVAKRFHGSLGGSLSASPIPQSPVIDVQAKASSSTHAVALANAGSGALVDAVNQLNEQQSKATANLLQEYEQIDSVLLNDSRTLASLQAQQAASPTDTRIAQQLVNAQTVVDSDKVQLNAVASAYADTFSPSKLNEQLVQPVGPAGATGNDRTTFLEIAVIAALVGGSVIACGAAVFVDLRRRSRA